MGILPRVKLGRDILGSQIVSQRPWNAGVRVRTPAKNRERSAKIRLHFHREVVPLEVIKALVRFLSYLFHGLLCLILLAMTALSMAAGTQSLNLQMLPAALSGSVTILFLCALFGLITVVLA